MQWKGIDHRVLTVKNIQNRLHFYCTALKMQEVTLGREERLFYVEIKK